MEPVGLSKKDVPANTGWLVTFADLLTLLSCSFLMVFSMTWNKTPAPGIRIAHTATKVQELSPLEVPKPIRLSEKELSIGASLLKEETKEKIQNAVKAGTYVVEVSFCGQEGAGRGSHLVSQLIDMGVPATRTALKLAGRHCGLVSEANDAVAIVSFKHG